jgi:DNA-binding MarR family transcriptional regulator
MSIRTDFTPSLLLAALRVASPKLICALHEAGHTAIRARHIAVFSHLHPEGVRFMALAEQAGVGSAAMGSLVDELENMKYLKPRCGAVGREQRVTPTQAGIDVMRLVQTFSRRYEMDLQRVLGPAAYTSFRESLRALAATADLGTGDRLTEA